MTKHPLDTSPDPGKHHCCCWWFRRHDGEWGRSSIGDGKWRRVKIKAYDCGVCNNTGWCT